MKKLSKNAIIGYPAGIITGITYGLNPLFAMPLMKNGAATESILFFRYAFAVLLLGLFLLFRKQSFRVSGKQIGVLFILGLLYTSSSIFLSMHTNTSLPDWLLRWYSFTPSSWPLSWCS
jgi:drug/metabolite transporter (DMT)-like permease